MWMTSSSSSWHITTNTKPNVIFIYSLDVKWKYEKHIPGEIVKHTNIG